MCECADPLEWSDRWFGAIQNGYCSPNSGLLKEQQALLIPNLYLLLLMIKMKAEIVTQFVAL